MGKALTLFVMRSPSIARSVLSFLAVVAHQVNLLKDLQNQKFVKYATEEE